MEDNFDCTNLDKNHGIISIKNKKVIGFFKIETAEKNWIDEFVCLESRMYSLKCEDDNRKKLKGVSKSQSKHIKFEEYKNCLDGKKYQEKCETYILRSVNHEMYLQQLKRLTSSIFDDKRCFINETESIPWN